MSDHARSADEATASRHLRVVGRDRTSAEDLRPGERSFAAVERLAIGVAALSLIAAVVAVVIAIVALRRMRDAEHAVDAVRARLAAIREARVGTDRVPPGAAPVTSTATVVPTVPVIPPSRTSEVPPETSSAGAPIAPADDVAPVISAAEIRRRALLERPVIRLVDDYVRTAPVRPPAVVPARDVAGPRGVLEALRSFGPPSLVTAWATTAILALVVAVYELATANASTPLVTAVVPTLVGFTALGRYLVVSAEEPIRRRRRR